jgi:hypothetical protein
VTDPGRLVFASRPVALGDGDSAATDGAWLAAAAADVDSGAVGAAEVSPDGLAWLAPDEGAGGAWDGAGSDGLDGGGAGGRGVASGGRGVGAGLRDGLGVGSSVGVGSLDGPGSSVGAGLPRPDTVITPPSRLRPWEPSSMRKITSQRPAESIAEPEAVPVQVPPPAVPEDVRSIVTVSLSPTSSTRTALGWGGDVAVYSTLKMKVVDGDPCLGDTDGSPTNDAAAHVGDGVESHACTTARRSARTTRSNVVIRVMGLGRSGIGHSRAEAHDATTNA